MYILKISISLLIIILCTYIAKKFPSFAGLIATMPLTGALIFVWLYYENSKSKEVIIGYAKGALFGIIPSILFFLVLYIFCKKQISFFISFSTAFAVWLIGAYVHQLFLR